MWVKGVLENGNPGRNLSDVMRPLYNLMNQDAKVFRLENDELKMVEDAAEQLEVFLETPQVNGTLTPEEFLKIATKAEGCAFRSVVEQDGNLYFGSYGRNNVFLIRVDQNELYMISGIQSSSANLV